MSGTKLKVKIGIRIFEFTQDLQIWIEFLQLKYKKCEFYLTGTTFVEVIN